MRRKPVPEQFKGRHYDAGAYFVLRQMIFAIFIKLQGPGRNDAGTWLEC